MGAKTEVEDDVALVARVLRGEQDAFATLIERHEATARRLASRMLPEPAEVEDVLQETVLAAYLNLRSLRSAERFAGWFCGIALNQCRMRLRRARRSPDIQAIDSSVADSADVPAAVEERALLEAIADAARALPKAQREAALLVYFDGLSLTEAARALGVSRAAMKVRLHRARSALRAQLYEGIERHVPRRQRLRRSGMVEMEVYDVLSKTRTSEQGQEITNAVILLREKGGARVLPIWVGEAEATMLALELQGVEVARPLTYHFTAALLESAGVEVRSVSVNKLVKDTFFASVEIERARTTAHIDARPSDAINIALRTGAPIFAGEEVLEKGGSRVRVTESKRAGSAALVESLEERQRLAREQLPSQPSQIAYFWREVGLEPLDDDTKS